MTQLPDIPELLVARFRGFAAIHLGLDFPPQRRTDLQRGIRAATTELGFTNPADCIDHLLSGPPTRHEVEVIASHLTIGETYFFREKPSVEALENVILPALIHSRRVTGTKQLRIWSAGCCTGEEPYTIGIILSRLLPDLSDWKIHLLATDINPHFLKKASGGVFTEWSFRTTDPSVKSNYFRKVAKSYEIAPEIHRLVKFMHLNLAEEVYPSPETETEEMDLILCRNVLIYFDPKALGRVVAKFHDSLAEGGCLLVGPSETSQIAFPSFVPVTLPGVVLYQKASSEVDAESQNPPAPIVIPVPGPTLTPSNPCDEIEATGTGIENADRAASSESRAVGHFVVGIPGTPTLPGIGAISDTYEQALAFFEGEQHSKAAAVLESLIAAGNDRPETLLLMARVRANEGKLADALALCERALSADKSNASVQYLRASILQEQGASDEAAAGFKRVIYLDHAFVLAHFALGNLARQAGNLTAAKKHFENARDGLHGLSPDDLVPESEGLTVSHFLQLLEALTQS